MKRTPYRNSKPKTHLAAYTYAGTAAQDDILQTPNRSENESWLLSYLDVFLLIIALLVIMLIRTPIQSPPPQDHQANEPPLPSSPKSLSASAYVKSAAVSNAISQLNTDHRVTVISNNQHINVRLDEALMFDSSKAVLKAEGKAAIQLLVPALKRLNRPLIIEGHTDDTPINTLLYPSNWELSAARANSVLHYLRAQGISPQQMSTANYADTRPLVPNSSQYNRSINRRVNLLIEIEKDFDSRDFEG